MRTDVVAEHASIDMAHYRRFDFSRLKSLREAFGESPEKFVKRFRGQIGSRAWRMWEEGTARPQLEKIEVIADVLNLDLMYFLAADDQSEPLPTPRGRPPKQRNGK